MEPEDKFKFSPFKYFERNNVPKQLVIVLVFLSILMIVFGNLFNIYDWILNPQFTEPLVTKAWFLEHTQQEYRRFYFYAFFVVDFIWAPLLLYILSKYIKTKAEASAMWFYYAYIVFAFIALAFDYVENTHYLVYKTYKPTIYISKVIAYGVTFSTALLVWLRFSLKNRFIIFRDFVSSSWISVLFLLIAGVMLAKAPQLNSIIVDLYSTPFQFVIVLLLFFAPIYSIVLSHYPNYLLFSKSNRKFKDKVWKISKTRWIFGFVWYRNQDNKGGNQYESYISFLRRTIGIFFYAAIYYMIAYTADINFDNLIKFSELTTALIVGLIFWLYVLKKRKDKWRYQYHEYLKKKAGETYDTTIDTNTITLNKPIHEYLVILAITLVIHLVLLVMLLNSDCPYNLLNVFVSLLCLLFQAITYTYYRTYRTLFKFAFFDKNNKAIIDSFPVMHDETNKDSLENRIQTIKNNAKTIPSLAQSKVLKRLSKLRIRDLSLGAASNNVIFLQIISYFGFVMGFLLCVINFKPSWSMCFNSIIIVLSYFFILYGAIIVILKHFIYYNLSNEDFATNNKHRFTFTVCTTIVVFVVLNHLARFNEKTMNNLYELAKIEETIDSTTVNLKEYSGNLLDTVYYIGCYGGGMKANAWTMTVLNALDKDGKLFDKTVCLSGASGGTIGLINYAAIKHNINSQAYRDATIRKISTENILSMDITHLLGRDLILHLFAPGKWLRGKDRSTQAMYTYAKYADSTLTKSEFDATSFRQQWYNMYSKRKKQNKRYPIFISNTTNIIGRQGMAVSIRVKDSCARDQLYLGADDILDLNHGKTLSFYNAVSTTNRFPLISPAATIEGKGQYNDGGIYENSGLLSAYKLYKAINELNPEAKKKKTYFINIVNQKTAYIKFKMDSLMQKCNDTIINKSNEISAIINSVAATEMLPSYIKDKLELLDKKNPNIDFESIYLPHKFNMEDIRAVYGPKIKDTCCVNDIVKLIKINDTLIDSLMKGCSKNTKTVIEPAMSRVMAEQAFDFMQYMIKHDDVREVLEKLQ
ncbi:MAG: hypothetical protein AAF611_00895 [Bacteroidota bacterium]